MRPTYACTLLANVIAAPFDGPLSGAALLLTLIPVVNFIAVPTAVAGATALWVGEFAGGAGDAQREPRGP